MRIARFLAGAGVGSRRGCEEIVRRGEVQINGERISDPACNVRPGLDRVTLAGRELSLSPKVSILLNKPPGYTCSAQDRHARHLVFELVPTDLGRLFTVGRLDRDSEGLLVLTNDGDLAQALAHPRHGVEKEYHVSCRGQGNDEQLARLRRGVRDDGEWLCPLSVQCLSQGRETCTLRLVLGEGRKREIRRLCQAVGLRVKTLRRVSLGPLTLGDLARGAWRQLKPEEVRALRTAASVAPPTAGPPPRQYR